MWARDQAGSGTATVASEAMSATLATTLRCRTSRQPYHRSASAAVRTRARARCGCVTDCVRADPDLPARRAPSTSSRRSARSPAGPVTERCSSPAAGRRGRPGRRAGRAPWSSRQGPGRLTAEAWGPGAEQALEELPRALGLDDGPFRVGDHHRVVTELARRFPGVRLTRTTAVLESLVPAILEQKVTGDEARRALARTRRGPR